MDLSELGRLTKQNEVADALRRAKELPWANCGNSPDAYCVGQALHLAAGGVSKLRDRAGRMFSAANGIHGKNHPRPLFNWNDARGRTHAEVLAAFDAAIALAEHS